VLTPLVPLATGLTVNYGASDRAYLDAVTGAIPASGRLPLDLPRSMEQVRRHHSDMPGYDDPLFPFGAGISL